MNEKENVLVVQQFFEAIAKRDLPSVQDMMAENVDWQSPVTRVEREEVSWAKSRHGRKVGKELFEKVQPEKLEPLEFTAQGNRVVVEGRNRCSARAYRSHL
jgi:ketosteroid isomerase-like protein